MLEAMVAGGALLVARLLSDIGILGIAVGAIAGMAAATHYPDVAATVDAAVRMSGRRCHQLLEQLSVALAEHRPPQPR